MKRLHGKTVLITSGGTIEKWDQVRGHTNLSRGVMGCHLAEEALAEGAKVIYLHGYFAKLPEHYEEMTTEMFEGIEDLGNKLKQFVQQQSIDVVIMAAAGSDWVIDKIYNSRGELIGEQGKIPSDEPPIIRFKKAPKVLKKIKKWAPHTTLVGFKLESTEYVEQLINRAKERMESAQAQFMVANSSKSLYGVNEPHFILNSSGDVIQVEGKQQTAKKLMELLAKTLS